VPPTTSTEQVLSSTVEFNKPCERNSMNYASDARYQHRSCGVFATSARSGFNKPCERPSRFNEPCDCRFSRGSCAISTMAPSRLIASRRLASPMEIAPYERGSPSGPWCPPSSQHLLNSTIQQQVRAKFSNYCERRRAAGLPTAAF